MLDRLFHGTLLIDVVMVLTLAECLALTCYYHYTGRGVPLREFGLNLLSGLLLMLALRSQLAAAGWAWTAACLAAAGLVHATDMWSRWKR